MGQFHLGGDQEECKGGQQEWWGGEEENVTLAAKGKKGKKLKKGSSSGAKQEKGKQKAKEKDMRKVKFFSCGKMGHYVVQRPNKKGNKKQGVVASANVDNFAAMFDSECALVVILATHVTSTRAWFTDSGASCHMPGFREHLTSLLEDGIDLKVVVGDNSKVKAAGLGTVSF